MANAGSPARAGRVVGTVVGMLLSALGCAAEDGGDDSQSAGSAGTAGAAGVAGASAGAAGLAGATATAGTGSGAGEAGTSAGTAGVGTSGASGTSGSSGSSGSAGAMAGSSGQGSSGNAGTAGNAGSSGAAGSDAGSAGGDPVELDPFSFFVTSLRAMQELSGSEDGFGGDLRYGEAHGLTGADKICTEIAEASMPGSSAKGWRAFLSVAEGPDGERVDAIDRIGEGPWYDRLGRIVAMDIEALQNARPEGADPIIVNDLPNEDGVPNQQPDPTMPPVDNHHILTGSDAQGRLYQGNVSGTCDNWSALEDAGRPRIGFSWPAGNRQHWISGQDEGGCGAGVNLEQSGGSDPSNPIVGSGGGYGGIYCFALMR